jgi:hypothetical protein
MFLKLSFLSAGLAACLCCAESSAQSVNLFGFTYTPLGGATLDASSGTKIVVGNLGSGGQDGVSITAPSGRGTTGGQPLFSPPAYGLDTYIAPLATDPAGAYIEKQTYGSLGGGSVQLLATETATELGGGTTSLALSLSSVWNGQPCTFNFYSGGPNGTLVYSETQSDPSTDANVYYWYDLGAGITGYDDVTPPGNPDTSIQSDGWDWWSGPGMHLDLTIKTPGGTVLPSTDNIDFMDFLVPATAATQVYSTSWTAGGGITSFAITGEALTVPEPSALGLAAAAAAGLAGCWWRKRRRRLPTSRWR